MNQTTPVLASEQRSKLDPTDDRLFYEYPRFVHHVDGDFLRRLTQLYSDRLQPHTKILDLMSSWVSHLPETMEFALVQGHGLNEAELARNPRLNAYFVQNLNQNQALPLPDDSFDAVLNAVGVQYLQYPEAVFSEIHRILKPQGMAIISFSNRMFYQKAIQAWRDGSESSRLRLVVSYFRGVKGGFSKPEVIQVVSPPNPLALLGFPSPDPFYAVIARKSDAN